MSRLKSGTLWHRAAITCPALCWAELQGHAHPHWYLNLLWGDFSNQRWGGCWSPIAPPLGTTAMGTFLLPGHQPCALCCPQCPFGHAMALCHTWSWHMASTQPPHRPALGPRASPAPTPSPGFWEQVKLNPISNSKPWRIWTAGRCPARAQGHSPQLLMGFASILHKAAPLLVFQNLYDCVLQSLQPEL